MLFMNSDETQKALKSFGVISLTQFFFLPVQGMKPKTLITKARLVLPLSYGPRPHLFSKSNFKQGKQIQEF